MPSINNNKQLVRYNPQQPTKRAVISCESSNSCKNHGCISETWYNDIIHENIAFKHAPSDMKFFFSTQWKLNYPGQVRDAVTAHGFELSPSDTENCGYQFQQNIGSTKDATYAGTLWVFAGANAAPYNNSVVDHAATVLGGTNPALPRDLAATSPFIIAGGSVVLIGLAVGLCMLPSCLRATGRKARSAGNSVRNAFTFNRGNDAPAASAGRQPRPYVVNFQNDRPQAGTNVPASGGETYGASIPMHTYPASDRVSVDAEGVPARPAPAYHEFAWQDTFSEA